MSSGSTAIGRCSRCAAWPPVSCPPASSPIRWRRRSVGGRSRCDPPITLTASRVVAALRTSPHVRVGDGHGEVIATVELDDGGARILDVAGEPLQATAQPVTDATLATLDDALRRLSRATQLRDLESGADAAALPDDVGLLYRRLVDGQEVEVAAGEHVYDGDRLVVRATNRSAETRYVTVLDVGLTGGVTILTPAQPSGTTMAAGQEVIVGENAAHAIEGVELYWPDHLPRGGPRPESFITIVADEPIDSLPALAQSGVATRAATAATAARSTCSSRTSPSGRVTCGCRRRRRSRPATGCTASTSCSIPRRARPPTASRRSRSTIAPTRRSGWSRHVPRRHRRGR